MPTIAPVSFASNQIRQSKSVAFAGKKDPADAFVNEGWRDYNGKPMKVGKKGGLGKVVKLALLAAVAVGVALHLAPAHRLAQLGPLSGIAQQGKTLVGQLVTKVKGWIPFLKAKAESAAATVKDVAGKVVGKGGEGATQVVEEVAKAAT